MKLNSPLAILALTLLCLAACDEGLNPRRSTLDTGTSDPNQWVPSGASMQTLTPRAVALLGTQCTLMRFDWFYLEEDLQPLSQPEIDQLHAEVPERFGPQDCGKQRTLYGLLATTPAADRDGVLEGAGIWFTPRDGHYLRPETLAQLEPTARLAAVDVAATCPDFETYLQGRKTPPSMPAAQWTAILRALRSAAATQALTGHNPETCAQLFLPGASPWPQSQGL